MAEIIRFKNQTQFAAIKLLVNLHGITCNGKDHMNVKCPYVSQISYFTCIIFHCWNAAIHLSSEDLKAQLFTWLFQLHTHIPPLKATELQLTTSEV